jgi:hypothetical protein
MAITRTSTYQRVIQQSLVLGGVTTLTVASMAYLQNRFNVADFFKRFDPTYAVPSVQTALILGAPVFGAELLSKSVEVLTALPSPNSGNSSWAYDQNLMIKMNRKVLAFHWMMTAVKTFVFIKTAEAIAKLGWPLHQKFIYQAAFIYAINSLERNDYGLSGVKAMLNGVLLVALIWMLSKMRFDALCRKLNLAWETPPHFHVFVYFSTANLIDQVSIKLWNEITSFRYGSNMPDEATSFCNVIAPTIIAWVIIGVVGHDVTGASALGSTLIILGALAEQGFNYILNPRGRHGFLR